MNILLTGSGGFIGNNLKSYLAGKYDICCPRSFELNLINKSEVKVFFKDRNFDLIIHCASVGGARGITDEKSVFFENVSMVENLIYAKPNNTKIILFGSGAMYGKTRKLHKVKENEVGIFVPEDFYGLSKLKISDIVNSRNDILMLNIFGCYGYNEKDTRFPTYAIRQNIQHKPIIINNDVIFDYLFVEDMCQIVEHFINFPSYDKIINITPTDSVSLVDISREINKISDYQSDIIVQSVKPEGEYTGNNEVLIRNFPDIKFTPLNVGLEKLYKYIRFGAANELARTKFN